MEQYKSKIMAFGMSKKGLQCENNEDNYQMGVYYKKIFIEQDSHTFESDYNDRYQIVSVFDGMGGGEGGEKASLYAAKEIYLAYMKLRANVSLYKDVEVIVKNAFQSANNRIIEDSSEILGTTGVVGIFDLKQNLTKFIWSGDSRAYLYRDNQLFQLTEDQSLGAERLRQRYYTKQNSQYRIDRNKLTGYIGSDEYGYIFRSLECEWIPLKEGDVFLLATDGFYESFSNEELKKRIKSCKENVCADKIKDVFNVDDSEDDATCIFTIVNV